MPIIRGVALFSFFSLLYLTWLYQVNKIVSEPYLDEVFHVGQVQAYCAGRFQTWDPKITTPPGLYILSYLFLKTKHLIFTESACGLVDLRWLNVLVASFIIPVQVWDLSTKLPRRYSQSDARSFHAVMNICLFPVLFFFSGLYYTDVCSVSFVLGAYQYHLRSRLDASTSSNLGTFVLGLYSLLMRQTNVFWVGIFFAGLSAVLHVKRINRQRSDETVDSFNVSKTIHDPSLNQAYLEDYYETAVSLAFAAWRDPISLLLNLWPSLALLALFSIFVLVNGGVVLGDKENHVASIHVPQILYIWPYITFFSWPVLLPHIIDILSGNPQFLRNRLPRPRVAITIMAVMTLAVHFNTIVHPFTLADNRHYVFYVFKLLLLHPPAKYAAVPIYFICAWATIAALSDESAPTNAHGQKTSSKASKDATPDGNPEPIRISFLLVYLTSTTLSLITAPLVEPRYFILPWLIWRLHVDPPPRRASSRKQSSNGMLEKVLQADMSTWLYLETTWFLLINLVTWWMFLHRGFEWKQEPGRVQRFMW